MSSFTLPVRVNCSLPRLVYALVGVRAEEVALGLRQILRQVRRAIRIEVGETRSHRQHGDAVLLRDADAGTPVLLCTLHPAFEIFIKQKILESGVALVSSFDGV